MRFAVDTGGTFTDLVVQNDAGEIRLYKASTVPEDPAQGVLDVLEVAARDLSMTRRALLQSADVFIHGTTRAINAILTRSTAVTALLVTSGHPDILLFREGGRMDVFNWTRPYPDPYIPRHLTFEVNERVAASGEVVLPLEEKSIIDAVSKIKQARVEAVAVCFLWSIVNPAHEIEVARCLDEHLPGVPYSLSHVVNPAIREYRRASATALDASLKPLMSKYLHGLEQRLRTAGLDQSARVLIVTSGGGMLDALDLAEMPVHSIGSGPAMAPVAGRHYARLDADAETAVVADAGGTSYDVSLVRRGRIPFTRETWLGDPFVGHMTGFPSIDVRSIGAGGGSLAWVDNGGLLHVGPQSAGADPGPACYGRGGAEPTVTDAALVLGYLDSEYFLGGAMTLDTDAASRAIDARVGSIIGLATKDAAAAVLEVVTENMARTIEELTVKQGIDPREAVLVGGGGAAGFNAVAIARRLGSPMVIIPEVAATLSAAGALMSDLTREFAATYPAESAAFDFAGVNDVLDRLERQCKAFIAGPGRTARESRVDWSVEARYPHQTWEIEVPLPTTRLASADDVAALVSEFHRVHEEIFAVSDPASEVEVLTWHARVSCRIRGDDVGRLAVTSTRREARAPERVIYTTDRGLVSARVWYVDNLTPNTEIAGPAIVESPVTTVVVEPDATAELRTSGSLAITPATAHQVDFVASRRLEGRLEPRERVES